jgi:hypothetical protein
MKEPLNENPMRRDTLRSLEMWKLAFIEKIRLKSNVDTLRKQDYASRGLNICTLSSWYRGR